MLSLIASIFTTAIAIIIGFGIAGLVHPGIGLQMASDAAVKVKEAPSIMQVFVAMIPANPVASTTMSYCDIIVLALSLVRR